MLRNHQQLVSGDANQVKAALAHGNKHGCLMSLRHQYLLVTQMSIEPLNLRKALRKELNALLGLKLVEDFLKNAMCHSFLLAVIACTKLWTHYIANMNCLISASLQRFTKIIINVLLTNK